MKKYIMVCAAFVAALAMTSCKSSESAYKKAYEKAQAQEQQRAAEQPVQTETPVVTPLETKSADETTVDNATYRTEKVTVVNGEGLKDYSVVVGSFGLKANAEGLQGQLKAAGYPAQVVYNADRNMYRVIATTFSDKASAVKSRNDLRAKYADAWLLFNK
ncbi:SPOR domain-containing protein [Prevotella sp. AGR2160]|uniref:SPOR domain-containing protein n=1 Tax=Prevotella sp. AGR2160 TaxID=1280674 RepID=UPI0004011114|nr:SPOR domain-containing protein [Prevotella sp. AGR2160]